MKTIFIHDHPFVIKDGVIYTSGTLTSSLWQNYMPGNSDSIKVFARNLQQREPLGIASHEKVDFVFSEYFKTPKDYFFYKNKIRNELKLAISDVDLAVVRLPSLLGLLAIRICKENKIPYMVEVVGNAYDAFKNYGDWKGKLLARRIHKLTQKAILKARYVIYVTEHFLQNVYPNKNITEFASNVVIESGNVEILNNRIDKVKQFNNKNFTVGSIGNTGVKYKGYEVVLQNIAIFKKEGITINYKIAGPGSQDYLRETAKSLGIEDQLQFEGSLSKSEIFTYLSTLDLFVHPSLLEGLPRVIVEAMSYAVPVLASAVGGIPELLNEKFLHQPGSYKSLYCDLKKVINGEFNLEKMAQANWEKAKEYDKNYLIKKKKTFFKKFYDENNLKKLESKL